MITTPQQRASLASTLKSIQQDLTKKLEKIDGKDTFKFSSWERPEGGGGTMSVLRGQIVEKAGVNYSEVEGAAYPAIEGEYKGKPFYATGVSTIAHMMNPYAPIGHMNVRMMDVGDTFWVGGGADLTPFLAFEEDTQDFHQTLKRACDSLNADSYEKYSKWCDEYFYIPHRKSVRGVGGIFFDYLKGDFDQLLGFIEKVAHAYVEVFPRILERRINTPYSAEEKEAQLYWRGRYAEFNLVYDRGTKFGLMTNGNIDAILVSMPPQVKW